MRRLPVLLTLLSLAGSQSTTEPTNRLCRCAIGTQTDQAGEHDFTVLFAFQDSWEETCDHRAAEVCREECQTRRDVLDAFGGWAVVAPGAENVTVGEMACQNLGRDETNGVRSELYTAVCEEAFGVAGHGVHEPLCCVDGQQVECRHQP